MTTKDLILSKDEIRIVTLSAKGLTAEEIHQKTGIPKKTIEKRTLLLCKKLKAKNKSHLMVKLIENGIIKIKPKQNA